MAIPYDHSCLMLAVCLMLTACDNAAPGSAARYDSSLNYRVDFVMPPNAPYISQQFKPDNGSARGVHPGIDIRDTIQSPVLAAAPGRVQSAYYEPAYVTGLSSTMARMPPGKPH